MEMRWVVVVLSFVDCMDWVDEVDRKILLPLRHVHTVHKPAWWSISPWCISGIPDCASS
jgi:hypothetical protein